MIKSIAKLIACVLTAVAALTYVSACAPQKSQETTNEPIWAYEKQNIVAGDSVYSYFPDGLDDVDQKIRIQSPAYSLQLNSKTGKLSLCVFGQSFKKRLTSRYFICKTDRRRQIYAKNRCLAYRI